MGRFRIQLLIPNGQLISKNKIDKNSIYSRTSTEWTLLSLDFTESKNGNEFPL